MTGFPAIARSGFRLVPGCAEMMGKAVRDGKFITDSPPARGKPVAFGRLKADEPPEAKQVGPSRFAPGKSVKDQTPCLT